MFVISCPAVVKSQNYSQTLQHVQQTTNCLRSSIGNRAFSVSGPHMWNQLPEEITSAASLSTFQRHLKTFLFSQSFPDIIADWHFSGPCGNLNYLGHSKKFCLIDSDCGWTCGCAGKTVKSLENTCHTWALLRWWFTTKRRYIKCVWTFTFKCMDLYLSIWPTATIRASVSSPWSFSVRASQVVINSRYTEKFEYWHCS